MECIGEMMRIVCLISGAIELAIAMREVEAEPVDGATRSEKRLNSGGWLDSLGLTILMRLGWGIRSRCDPSYDTSGSDLQRGIDRSRRG